MHDRLDAQCAPPVWSNAEKWVTLERRGSKTTASLWDQRRWASPPECEGRPRAFKVNREEPVVAGRGPTKMVTLTVLRRPTGPLPPLQTQRQTKPRPCRMKKRGEVDILRAALRLLFALRLFVRSCFTLAPNAQQLLSF